MVGLPTTSRAPSRQEQGARGTVSRPAIRPGYQASGQISVSRALLDLQRVAGNRSVEGLLQRADANPSYGAMAAPLATIQRSFASGASDAAIWRQPVDDSKQDTHDIGPGGGGGPSIPGTKLYSTPPIPISPTPLQDLLKGLSPKSPDGGASGGPVGPDACAPGMYDKLQQKCCPDGYQAGASGMGCVQVPPVPLPQLDPAAPEQPGDYNTGDPNADTQMA